MKRREFLKAAGLGVAGGAIAAPATAQSMPEIKWRMTASWPKSLDTLWGACELMAKAVAEATDNKFQLQTFAAGENDPAVSFSTDDLTQAQLFKTGCSHFAIAQGLLIYQ